MVRVTQLCDFREIPTHPESSGTCKNEGSLCVHGLEELFKEEEFRASRVQDPFCGLEDPPQTNTGHVSCSQRFERLKAMGSYSGIEYKGCAKLLQNRYVHS